MAHRGRLNVLTNIAGKTYGQIFREFEGSSLPGSVSGQGSGDVKYHVGTEGVFRASDGTTIPVTIAANPSHLEAVDGVLEGIVRAKQDKQGPGSTNVLPVLVHGDAAMAGQGVVVETLQMSQLRGYRRVAPSTSSSTTRSGSRPRRSRHAARCTPPTSRRRSRRRSST